MKDEHIWASIDQSTDSKQNHISNIIVGHMNATKQKHSYLIHSEKLPKTNNSTVIHSLLNGLTILWPKGIQYNKVLLFLTDAAPYNKTAFKTLTNIFPKMIHVTCVCHGLDNVCNLITKEYPNVNQLIVENLFFTNVRTKKNF